MDFQSGKSCYLRSDRTVGSEHQYRGSNILVVKGRTNYNVKYTPSSYVLIAIFSNRQLDYSV